MPISASPGISWRRRFGRLLGVRTCGRNELPNNSDLTRSSGDHIQSKRLIILRTKPPWNKKETNKMRTMPQLNRDFFVGHLVCFLVLLLLFFGVIVVCNSPSGRFGGRLSVTAGRRLVLVALKAQTSSDSNLSKARVSLETVGGGSLETDWREDGTYEKGGLERRHFFFLEKRCRFFQVLCY